MPGVAGANESLIANVRDAAAAVVPPGDDLVVVMSPHGSECGVYAEVAGSLDDFGIRERAVEEPAAPALARELAARWGRPLLAGPVDHGVTVPLLLGVARGRTVVAAALAEEAPAEEIRATARALARAVGELAGDRDVALVASAHTSSALSARAPLGCRPEAVAAADELVASLRGDGDLVAAAEELQIHGATCSAAPLLAWAEVFARSRREVLIEEHPFGVGYVVARALP